MNFEDLKNPELQEKLRAAKTADELVTLAKEEGLELTDEQLESLSGGEEWYEFCLRKAGYSDPYHGDV